MSSRSARAGGGAAAGAGGGAAAGLIRELEKAQRSRSNINDYLREARSISWEHGREVRKRGKTRGIISYC